jgi:plastocyanin
MRALRVALVLGSAFLGLLVFAAPPAVAQVCTMPGVRFFEPNFYYVPPPVLQPRPITYYPYCYTPGTYGPTGSTYPYRYYYLPTEPAYSSPPATVRYPSRPARPISYPANPPGPADTKSPVDVSLFDNQFDPATITVPVGTTVRWTNRGLERHTVTSTTGDWGSEQLTPTKTFEYTFKQPGTYPYRSTVIGRHELKGQVIVQ